MLLIAGTVRIPEANIAMARPAIARMIEATRAEDGCLSYAFAQDVVDPSVIHVSETWRDHAALRAHAQSPHMAEWRAAAGELGLSERDLRLYETDEGQAL